jgi:hypothetical protein
MWSRLLDLAIQKEVHALIDAGELSLPRLDLLCRNIVSSSFGCNPTLQIAK